MKYLSLFEMQETFSTEEKAKAWFEKNRWDGKVKCPYCGGVHINEVKNGKPMDYWCRDGQKYFSVRTGTQMERSRLPLKVWGISIYLYLNNPKGLTSVLLSKYLTIRQGTTWHLLHRIRAMCPLDLQKFDGTVEVDEAYLGGQRANMSK